MGGHLDVHEILGHLGERHVLGFLHADIREHQFLVGVLVIDDQETMVAAVLDRDVAHEITVVAELACLLFRRLGLWVEGQGVGKHRIAPAQEDVGIVPSAT